MSALRGVEYDGCIDRFTGYAYADGHDCRTCDGDDGEHCAGGRAGEKKRAVLGTTVAQAISVGIALTVIIRKRSIVLGRQDFQPKKTVMGKILSIGIPIACQDGLIQVAFIVITIIANRRGLNDAAAVGIVEKIISFLFLVPYSMLSAASVLGAQNIGAKKPERRLCGWAVSISKAMSGTACLRGFIFASVVISVTVESRDYRFYITFWQSCLFAYRESI